MTNELEHDRLAMAEEMGTDTYRTISIATKALKQCFTNDDVKWFWRSLRPSDKNLFDGFADFEATLDILKYSSRKARELSR